MSVFSKSVEYSKITLGFAWRVIMPFLFGIILNWLFAVFFMFSWLRSISIANSVPAMVMIAIFCVGFPWTYFWLARGHAIKKGLEFLYGGSQGIVAKVVGLAVESAVASKEKGQDGQVFKKGKKKGVAKAGSYVKKVQEKVPRPIRMILVFILEQLPLKHMLMQVGEEVTLKSDNIEEIKPKVQEKVDSFVINVLIGADLLWFWLLTGVNLLLMFVAVRYVI